MSNDIFDQKRIKRLIELMKENDLSELDIQQGDLKVQLKRAVHAVAAPNYPPSYPYPLPNPSVGARQEFATPVTTKEPEQAEPATGTFIKSPMVGTFYTASNPESPSFVKIGDSVSPETTVCLIEAMKVYNEIQAEISGKIVATLAKNGETVEFGQPLFRVE